MGVRTGSGITCKGQPTHSQNRNMGHPFTQYRPPSYSRTHPPTHPPTHPSPQVLAASLTQKYVVWGTGWIMECHRLGRWVPVGLRGFKHADNLFEGKTVVVLPSFRKSAHLARMQILPILIQTYGRGKLEDFSSASVTRKRAKEVFADYVLIGDGLGHPGRLLEDYNISVDEVWRWGVLEVCVCVDRGSVACSHTG